MYLPFLHHISYLLCSLCLKEEGLGICITQLESPVFRDTEEIHGIWGENGIHRKHDFYGKILK